MSRGTKLQEMEVKTQQSKTAVNAGAKAGDPMPTMADPGTQLAGVEDLGGPTPENYKPDDDSAKLKTPGGTLKQVKDVVNKGAKAADSMKGMKEEEVLDTEETIEEEEVTTDEVVAEEEVVEEEVVDIEDDVNALLGGEDLSEEFREKAKVIFEAAVKTRVSEVKESLEQQFAVKLSEEIEETKAAIAERVDSYLEYVSEEWFTENELAIEAGLKTEMTESFLSGMKGLFEEHYVQIPEEKYDVLSTMVEKLDEMENKLNEQIKSNIALNQRLAESVADVIFSDVCEGLALSQKEKLASLAENVEFDSEDTYREKLVTLRKSYFPENAGAQRDESETISESTDTEVTTSTSPLMEGYLSTLNRVSKK